MSVRYEASISLGNVLTIVVILVTLAGAVANLSARLSVLETKIMPLWDEYADTTHGNFYQHQTQGKP